MERKMRRIRQLLSEDDAKGILTTATNGVLSLVDADGSPYGVPLSFAYDNDGHIYFHSAVERTQDRLHKGWFPLLILRGWSGHYSPGGIHIILPQCHCKGSYQHNNLGG